jgi:GNAT superfamily N-acetyltransferase
VTDLLIQNVNPAIRVRSIRADEWPALREIRLRALRDAPEAFLTTAATAEREADAYWSNRAARAARGDGWAIFFAHAGAGETIGMAAGFETADRPGEVELIQMWVDPVWRSRSVGARLVEAVVDWAAPRADRVRLGVATDNRGAISLYERCGFQPTGEEQPFEGRDVVRIRYYERTLR